LVKLIKTHCTLHLEYSSFGLILPFWTPEIGLDLKHVAFIVSWFWNTSIRVIVFCPTNRT
jgi:hypothetical protein